MVIDRSLYDFSYAEPLRNPDQLSSIDMRVSGAYLQHFNGIAWEHGHPFFIVRRTLEYHANTACVKRVPNLWIESEYFLGVLAEEGDVVSLIHGDSHDSFVGSFGIVLNTKNFARMSKQSTTSNLEHGALLFKISVLDYTPYLSPMRDPQTGKETWAFSVATDLRQMEDLALDEPCIGYFEAAHLLGFPIISEGMQTALRTRKETILSELLHCHTRHGTPEMPERHREELIKKQFCRARALGMEEDYAQVSVHGIRYRPAEVLEDLAHRYPSVAAP